jgi:hypothetical protein
MKLETKVGISLMGALLQEGVKLVCSIKEQFNGVSGF